MDPDSNVFQSSFAQANGATKSNGLNSRSPSVVPPSPSAFLNCNLSEALQTPGISSKSSERRVRSVSLQHEVISLKSMGKALNSPNVNGRQKSISFSGMSIVIDSLLKASVGITEVKKREVKRAVTSSDLPALERICSQDPWTALAAAVEAIDQTNPEVLDSILELSVKSEFSSNIDFLREYGKTLLTLSTQYESALSCCRVLLLRGVSPNERSSPDSPDLSAMHSAAKAGNHYCIEMMHQEFNGNINIGSDIDGGSVLHAAVKANSPETVRYLLANGAKNTSKEKFSCSALHLAAENNHVVCAELLLEDGALVDALRGEAEKVTALHLAAQHGYGEMAKLLLGRKADPNAENGNGETPLHLACKFLSDTVIKMLIEKGANVDAQDREGRPPLHCVINSKQKGGTNCIRILLENNADVNLTDKIGMSPLHLAAVNNSMSRINILIENGADLCALNSAGKSAFYTAIKHAPNSFRSIEKRLDKGLILENPGSDSGPIIKMDFFAIVPRASKNNLTFTSEVGLFSEVLNFQQNDPSLVERLLMHPLAEGYLQLKWSQIKWLYFILMVFTHLIYSITYSVYAVLVFKALCKPELMDNITSTVTCDFNFTKTGPDNVDSNHQARVVCAQVAWIFLIIFTITYLVKEFTKLAHLRQRYLWTLEAWLNILVVLSVVLITFYSNPFDRDVTVYRWQYHACGFGVFLTWLLQMFLIGKVPRFGKYVEMFKNVSKTFSNFFVSYIFLFVSFAVSFFILFPTHSAFNEVLPAALVKVLVMMLGELEYDGLYYPQKKTLTLFINGSQGIGKIEEETESQYFPFTAHILVTVFVLLVSIIIMNLLFGLAVTDIQELYKVARLHQLIQQVELITYMENILFSPIFKFFPDCLQKILRRTLQGLSNGGYRYVKILNTSDHSDKSLSVNLKKKIVDHTLSLINKDNDKSRLEREVDEMRKQLTSIQNLLKEVLNQQKTVVSYSRASTIREDSDNDDVVDSTNRKSRLKDFESGDPAGRMTMSASISLGRICEESPSPKASTSRSYEKF